MIKLKLVLPFCALFVNFSASAALVGYAGGGTPSGLYEIDPTTGTATFVTAVESQLATGGLAKLGGEFFATNYSFAGQSFPDKYGILNIRSGEFTPFGTQDSLNWYGLTADTSGDLFYVIDEETRTLLKFHPGQAVETVGTGVSQDGTLDIRGMAYDRATGTLYASEYYDGVPNLYSIDTTTGVATLIGSLGFPSAQSGGDIPLAFDEENRILYAHESVTRKLYTVNPASGAATAIGTSGVPLGSLAWFPDPPATYRLTYVGSVNADGSYANDMNSAGQVTGFQSPGISAFVWDAGNVQEIGTLGGNRSDGVAINSDGLVAGYSDLPGNAVNHAFLWDGFELLDLGALSGALSSQGTSVNSAGMVVGWADTTEGQRAFLWDGATQLDLGTLGGMMSRALKITDSEMVIGDATTASEQMRAVTWTNGTIRNLGTLGGNESSATDANESGLVTGYALDGSGQRRAFLWNGNILQNLGALAGDSSTGLSINADGWVAGSSTSDAGAQHAVIWGDGALNDLGTLGGATPSGAYSHPYAINSSGLVTGLSSTYSGEQHAFVGDRLGIFDLNHLVDPDDPLQPFVTLNWGQTINDFGQIIAIGSDSRDGEPSGAYLVSPSSYDDNTSPQIAPVIVGSLGNDNWYVSDTRLRWAVVDPQSPVFSKDGCSNTSVTNDTSGTDFTCEAASHGGSSTQTITIKLDTTIPVVSAAVSPIPNNAGWTTTATTISFSGQEGPEGSGIDSCSAPVTLATDGAGQQASGNCIDRAGNESTAIVATISVDQVAPTVSVSVPANGTTYSRNQSVTASYTCSDSLSGMANCSGPVASGATLSTRNSGQQSFRVTGTDAAGNQTVVTVSYTVAGGSSGGGGGGGALSFWGLLALLVLSFGGRHVRLHRPLDSE